ncbi:MAG: hypothetical protein ABJI69_09275 [Balneola sp.]
MSTDKKHITLTIGEQDFNFEIRTPSLFNRNQFFMLISSVFDLEPEDAKTTSIDLNDIFVLSEDDFRRFLAASVLDPDRVLSKVDFEEHPNNYGQAQIAIRVFFIELIQIASSLKKSNEVSTSKPKSSEKNTA